MKCDMAGAAHGVGRDASCSRLKLPVNLIGLVGLVENMTGGAAMKLGDVLTARSGKTIEVLNTDAEGRLVLAGRVERGLGSQAREDRRPSDAHRGVRRCAGNGKPPERSRIISRGAMP